MTWHAHTGSRKNSSGKFHSQAQFGTRKSEEGQHRGWHYNLVAHQTSGGVRRTRYAVTISDPKGHKANYLRGFSHPLQAKEAAQRWIDQTLGIELPKPQAGDVGSIPALPKSPLTASKIVGQEK